MSNPKLKNTLEMVTNVAVLLAATGILAALSWGFFVQRRAPSVAGGLRKGQAVASLPNVDYARASKTLLVLMDTKCRYCTESVPFYNSLAEGRGGTRVVTVFPNEEGEVRQYVREQQLRLETVAGVDLRALRVQVTPTMILVGGDGRILDFWIGKLSEDSETLVAAALATS